MSRFFLSPHAHSDLTAIKTYLETVPKEPALRIARALQRTLISIADNPYHGIAQSELTRLAGVEVRSRLVHSYRILYIVGDTAPEIIGIMHTARDIASTMEQRLR